MIKKGIIPWVLVLIFGFIVVVVISVQFGVSRFVQNRMEVAASATCTPKQLETVWYAKIYLTMDCSGVEYWSHDEETVVAFANYRKIPTCALFKSGRASCVEQTQN